jgi:arsenite methyltransferase
LTIVSFRQGDAERLPLKDASFDAIICECAFCTFPDKPTAAREFARILRPSGRVGLSDLTRGPVLPNELDGLLAWVACIADAQPIDSYEKYLDDAGFRIEHREERNEALLGMVDQIRMKLLGAEIIVGLKKHDLPNLDLSSAKHMAQAAQAAVKRGALGYAIICGVNV